MATPSNDPAADPEVISPSVPEEVFTESMPSEEDTIGKVSEEDGVVNHESYTMSDLPDLNSMTLRRSTRTVVL